MHQQLQLPRISNIIPNKLNKRTAKDRDGPAVHKHHTCNSIFHYILKSHLLQQHTVCMLMPAAGTAGSMCHACAVDVHACTRASIYVMPVCDAAQIMLSQRIGADFFTHHSASKTHDIIYMQHWWLHLSASIVLRPAVVLRAFICWLQTGQVGCLES